VEKKEGSDVEGGDVSSSSTIAVDSKDISFDIVSPMNAGNKKRDDSFDVVSPMHAKKENKEATANKASFEPKSVASGPVEADNTVPVDDAPSAAAAVVVASAGPVEASTTSA
jgi:hypothetical protein